MDGMGFSLSRAIANSQQLGTGPKSGVRPTSFATVSLVQALLGVRLRLWSTGGG